MFLKVFLLLGFMYFHFPFEVCGRVQKGKYFIMSMNYSGMVLGVNITLNSSRSFFFLEYISVFILMVIVCYVPLLNTILMEYYYLLAISRNHFRLEISV